MLMMWFGNGMKMGNVHWDADRVHRVYSSFWSQNSCMLFSFFSIPPSSDQCRHVAQNMGLAWADTDRCAAGRLGANKPLCFVTRLHATLLHCYFLFFWISIFRFYAIFQYLLYDLLYLDGNRLVSLYRLFHLIK